MHAMWQVMRTPEKRSAVPGKVFKQVHQILDGLSVLDDYHAFCKLIRTLLLRLWIAFGASRFSYHRMRGLLGSLMFCSSCMPAKPTQALPHSINLKAQCHSTHYSRWSAGLDSAGSVYIMNRLPED